MNFPAPLPVPEIEINDPVLDKAGMRLTIRREDLNHPEFPGNKFWKLKYNLLEANKAGHTTILTFGGAYSNHIAATAAACKINGFKSIGIIRGEDADLTNPTLSLARKNGMFIHPISRSDYRLKSANEFLQALKRRFGDCYIIPEGGTNRLAIEGIKEMVKFFRTRFNILALPVGTGGTIAGCIQALQGESSVMGFSVLKGSFLTGDVEGLLEKQGLPQHQNWRIVNDYHCGGYGKVSTELMSFIRWFEKQHGIPLDQVYTGKMMFGLYDLIQKGFFSRGNSLMALHTGGLQGRGQLE